MTRALLDGAFWTPALIDHIVTDQTGQGAPNPLVQGPDAARALYFANATGLDIAVTGQDTTLSAPQDLDPALLEAAAPEIMRYFGRRSAEEVRARLPMILSRAAARLIAAHNPVPASLRSDLATSQVDCIENETPFEGYFLTKLLRLRHPQFNGTQSEVVTREVFVATDAALVLPYDPVRDRLLLIEQFRMGPYGRGDPLPWVLEPVAGRLDGGETPQDTARRECLEEADLNLGRLEHISSHYCSPGCSTEVFHCFVGLCDLPDAGHSHGGLETEHEDLRRHVISFDDAMRLMHSGEINIGPLFAMLLWLERERPRLRASA